MISRRNFIQQSAIASFVFGILPVRDIFCFENEKTFRYQSRFIKLQLDKQRPEFTFFSTDNLGHSQFNVNTILNNKVVNTEKYISKVKGNSISYHLSHAGILPAWDFSCSSKQIKIRSEWVEDQIIDPFTITFSQKANHCTVLGHLNEDKQIKFPCILHFPCMGTFRIRSSSEDASLFYDAYHISAGARKSGEQLIKIAFPAATAEHPNVLYTLESVAIFPEISKIHNNPAFDGFRKNYINIFQLNPRAKVLANNSTSDNCTFTLFLYAEMARKTPELAKGLTAMDMIRESLEHYLDGMKGYGQVGHNINGWLSIYDSSDSMPSLIISACYYILDTRDIEWARKNYVGIKLWADKMIATDKNNDGIIEYGHSGNSGSWKKMEKFQRPANWWDTIGFGHDDAYSNALAYHAIILLATVAKQLNFIEDHDRLSSFAVKLKSNYYRSFYNPATGVLAGWKSEDGKLHDYYFIFVNSVAICYNLLDETQSKQIMKTLLAKMKEVGYTNFKLGLPGNLIPVRKDDYVEHNKRWGGSEKEDGSDGFQIYENGGASGCYAYYTIKALYQLNMRKEADDILLAMLESYKIGDFEGYCAGSKMTKDWKTWNGNCWGYEGFLVDNYLPLLAVLDY